MQLNGQALTLPEIAAVALGDATVEVSPSARPRLLASRKVIEDIIARDAVVYGVTTGFGKLSDVRVPHGELRELQLNLVRSHACGIGPPLSEAEARAMMLLRANVLALGLDGLALLNRPQAMHAVGELAVFRAKRLSRLADVSGAMSLEALKGTPAAFDLRLQDARPHPGQKAVAKHLLSLLEGSEIRQPHLKNDPRVQDAYSLRCMPQVHGAVRGALSHCEGVLIVESG